MKIRANMFMVAALASASAYGQPNFSNDSLLDRDSRKVSIGVSTAYQSFAKQVVVQPNFEASVNWNQVNYLRLSGDQVRFTVHDPDKRYSHKRGSDATVTTIAAGVGQRYKAGNNSEAFLEVGLTYYQETVDNVVNIEFYEGFETEYSNTLLTLVAGGRKQLSSWLIAGELKFHGANPDFDTPLLLTLSAAYFPTNWLSLAIEPQLSAMGDIRKAGINFSTSAHF